MVSSSSETLPGLRVGVRTGLRLVMFAAAAWLLGCAQTAPSADAASGPDAGAATDAGATPPGDAGSTAGGDAMSVPDAETALTCAPNARWSNGRTIFREATEARGLVSVEGTRLAAADVDGDGRADLFVRRGGNGADDFGPGGLRQSWLLLNTPGGFVDHTLESGIRRARSSTSTARGRPGEVVAFADVDNDGDLDVYTGMNTGSAPATETSELLLNDGLGHFTLGDADDEVRQARTPQLIAGATFVDVDLDGFVDLYTARGAFVRGNTQTFMAAALFRGAGDGRFVEATDALGLRTSGWNRRDDLNGGRAHANAWSSLACDLNGDGLPELMVGSYGRAPNLLFQATREADAQLRYLNRSVDSGYAFDQNQDWTGNEFARCYCARNRSAEGCATVPAANIGCGTMNWDHANDRQPFRNGGNNGTAVCADVDNDGDLDLLTTTIAHWWAGPAADRSELLTNSGEQDVRFERPGLVPTGLERGNPRFNWDNGDMTAAIFDFDNDGWPDVYVGASDYAGNAGLLFHQLEPLLFEPVPPELGVDHHRSHGVAVADFDRDGDLDLVVGHSRARCDPEAPKNCYPTANIRYFENILGQDGNWLQLDLVGGDGTNRAAIGARVQVRAGDTVQTQEVGGGHGHYGIQHDRVLHFGLGADCRAEVTVRWPNAELTTQTFQLDGQHRYRVEQGQAPVLVP